MIRQETMHRASERERKDYRLDGHNNTLPVGRVRKRYKTGDGGYDDTPSKWMGNDGDEEKVKGVPKAA